MKLIDTNVVMYSVGGAHPYKAYCERVFKMVAEAELEANIDTELLQEVLHVFRRRDKDAVGLGLFDQLLDVFPDPYPIARATATIARSLMGQHPLLGGRDAFHAAVVIEYGLEGIISADRAFDGITSVKRFDPKEFV